jgi:hypothetical protein
VKNLVPTKGCKYNRSKISDIEHKLHTICKF